jgi:hypothetical protein
MDLAGTAPLARGTKKYPVVMLREHPRAQGNSVFATSFVRKSNDKV